MTRVSLPLTLVALFAAPELTCAVEPARIGSVDKQLFSRHVVPLFSRLGCNAGACRGSVKGQNGFRLSLFGANPTLDHSLLLREFAGRRLNPFEPEKCLLLLKAEDLGATGMLERTIVMVLGEMGRTPKINKDAGRDYWGTCQSVLVAGGGFAGVTVVGATDKHAAYAVDKYYQVESFGRTIYHLLGIDPDQTLYALDNRPHRLIGEDTPLIKEAIA
ncbi:MAG: DUF1501 domain-containing protein [Gemmataceae bacterium]